MINKEHFKILNTVKVATHTFTVSITLQKDELPLLQLAVFEAGKVEKLRELITKKTDKDYRIAITSLCLNTQYWDILLNDETALDRLLFL